MRLFLVLDDEEAVKESRDLRPEGSPKRGSMVLVAKMLGWGKTRVWYAEVNVS